MCDVDELVHFGDERRADAPEHGWRLISDGERTRQCKSTLRTLVSVALDFPARRFRFPRRIDAASRLENGIPGAWIHRRTMLNVIHVSDLHLTERPSANSWAERLLQRVRERFFDVSGRTERSFLLVTGDITEQGDFRQYDEAFRLLSPFAGKLLMEPGNHDIAGIWHLPSPAATRCDELERQFTQEFAPRLGVCNCKINELQVTRISDGGTCRVMAIGVESASLKSHHAKMAQGEVGPKQLEALARALDDAKKEGRRTLVYLHHNPLAYTPQENLLQPDVMEELNELEDAPAFLTCVKGKADVVAYGHHVEKGSTGQVVKLGGTWFVNLNDTEKNKIVYRITFDSGAPGVSVTPLTLSA